MARVKKTDTPEGKIEKAEDKVWKEEFDSMKVEDHEKILHQLGLDEEDIQEWEEMAGFKEPKPEHLELVEGDEEEKKPVKKAGKKT
jgi:hypothetical protein